MRELRGRIRYPTKYLPRLQSSCTIFARFSLRTISYGPSNSVDKPVIRMQHDLQYWTNEHRHPLHKLLERGVWSVSVEDGQDLGVPQTDVNGPKCKRVKRDFEGRPAFPKSDFRKTRLTLLDVQFKGGKDLFIVVRFTLENRKWMGWWLSGQCHRTGGRTHLAKPVTEEPHGC